MQQSGNPTKKYQKKTSSEVYWSPKKEKLTSESIQSPKKERILEREKPWKSL